MRPYTHYLDRIKSEAVKSAIHLAGTTPPPPKVLKTAKLRLDVAPADYPKRVQSLKAAIAKKAGARIDQIALMPGTTQAAFQVLAATTEPGDTIVLEQPVYEPYVAAARFLGLEIRRFRRTDDCARDLVELQRVCAGARVLLISNPHCPTGWMYELDCVDQLAGLGLTVVVDEVFVPAFTGGELSHRRRGHDNVILLAGLSKSSGLGSARVGWTISTPEVARTIERMGNLLHVDFPAPILPVAEFVLKNWGKVNAQLMATADGNRDVLVHFAKTHPGVLTNDFRHGFFSMLRVPPQFASGADFVTELLRSKIYVRDGAEFEMPDWVRIHCLVEHRQFAKVFAKISSYY